MPTLEAGTVFVQVAPSFKGFQQAAAKAGVSGGETLAAAFEKTASAAKVNLDGSVKGAGEEGAKAAAEFQATFRASLESASARLAEVKVGADSSEADRKLAELRARMATLSSKTIGVDIDAAEAYMQLGLIESELVKLSAKHPDIDVKANVVKAITDLQTVALKAEELDGKDVDIDVKADSTSLNGMGFAAQSAGAMIGLLAAAITFLGPAAVTASNVAIGALVGIGAAAAGAAGAIGTSLLALVPVVGAVTKLRMARDKVSAGGGGGKAPKAPKAGMSRDTHKQDARQVANAQKQIEAAHKAAVKSADLWEKRIAAAEKNVAKVSEAAAKRVENAQKNLGRVRQQAARQVENANRAVAAAERNLARAQKNVLKAQEALSKARRDAVKDLRDLEDAVKDGALAQRAAVLHVKQAKKALEDLGRTGGSDLDWEAARLALDQANQSLAEQKTANQDLAEQKARIDKEGVDGTDRVRAAQERLAAAQEHVADAVQAVSDAQQQAAEQAKQAAESIAAAEKAVVDARLQGIEDQENALEKLRETQKNASEAALDNADREQEAKQRLAETMEDISDRNAKIAASAAAAGGASVAAAAAVQDSLSELPESGRAFALYLDGLIDRFGQLSVVAQDGFLPGLQRGLESLEPHFPAVSRLVDDLATRLGRMAENGLKSLNGPRWVAFGNFLAQHLGPAMEGFGQFLGNVLTGLRDLIMALQPLGTYFEQALIRGSQSFAAWAAGLQSNSGFQAWMQSVMENAPKVGKLIGSMCAALGNLWNAAGGGDGTMGVTRKLTDFFDKIANADPGKIQAIAHAVIALGTAFAGLAGVASIGSMIGSVSNGLGRLAGFFRIGGAAETAGSAASAATSAVSAAGSAGGGGLLAGITQLGSKLAALAGPIGIAIAVITALVAGIKYLWDTNEGFRATVMKAWAGIQDMFTKAYNQVLKPVFEGIGTLFKVAADIFQTIFGGALTTIWDTILQPLFELMGTFIGDVFNRVLLPMWKAGADAFKVFANVIKNVWETALKPVFETLKTIIRDVFEVTFKNVLNNAKRLFQDYAGGLGKILDGIKTGFAAFGKFLTGDFSGAWRTAKDAISKIWNGMKQVAAAPVNFVINTVYNNGLRAAFNKLAGVVGIKNPLPAAPRIAFASGGVLPGFTPGRDIHKFWSPTGGTLLLSGGEGIIRPDALRALGGKKWLDWVNKHLRGGKYVADPGDWRASTGGVWPGPVQKFSGGGIFSAAKNWGSNALGAVQNAMSSVAGFVDEVLSDPIGAVSSLIFAPVKSMLGGIASTPWGTLFKGVPGLFFNAIKRFFKIQADKIGGGFGDRLVRYLRANIVGKVPYVWGGASIPPGLDCSGMVYYGYNHMPNPVRIPRLTAAGYDNAGKKVAWNQKRKGDLLVNANQSHIQVYSGGSSIIEEPRPGKNAQEVPIRSGYHAVRYHQYDQGGWLPQGVTQTLNLTGKPEPVFTPSQWNTLDMIARDVMHNHKTGSGPSIHVTNNYPQAEPTSVTINRTLQLSAAYTRSI